MKNESSSTPHSEASVPRRGRGRPRKNAVVPASSRFQGNQYTMRRQHVISMSEAFIAGYTLGQKEAQQQQNQQH